MAVTVLGDLLARDRRTDALALLDDVNERQYDYRRFCTTAWKVGNLLRHFGVRAESSVAVAADTKPVPILSFFGAALLGGVVRIGSESTTPRVLVAPTTDLDTDPTPGTHRIGYGERPDDPSDSFFEQDVWRENPTRPPAEVEPDTPVLRSGEAAYTHREVLRAARSVVERWDLTADSVVAVRAPLGIPETIVAGVVAPLLVGATVLLPDDDCGGENTVATTIEPEPRELSSDAVELQPSVSENR